MIQVMTRVLVACRQRAVRPARNATRTRLASVTAANATTDTCLTHLQKHAKVSLKNHEEYIKWHQDDNNNSDDNNIMSTVVVAMTTGSSWT